MSEKERWRGIRWSSVGQVLKLLGSLAVEAVQLIDALRGGR
jgi:hypothetical protein